ncbi:MAG: hypothetical protein WDA26_06620 [Pusillimonas sp.]
MWFDNFYAVPTIGIQYESNRSDIFTIQKTAFSYDETYKVECSTFRQCRVSKEGLEIVLEPGNIIASHKTHIEIKPDVYGRPVVKESESKTYLSTLKYLISTLYDLITRLCEIDSKNRHREITQIGIVLSTRMQIADVPPGISSLLEAQTRIWQQKLLSYDFRLLTEISKENGISTRCHHMAKKTPEPDEDLDFALDYQRIYRSSNNPNLGSFNKICEAFYPEAVLYFESFGKKGIQK